NMDAPTLNYTPLLSTRPLPAMPSHTPPASPAYPSPFPSNPTAPTEISTISLHDALPISGDAWAPNWSTTGDRKQGSPDERRRGRSEEHTSELQSRGQVVFRLLLEKKKSSVGGELVAEGETPDAKVGTDEWIEVHLAGGVV